MMRAFDASAARYLMRTSLSRPLEKHMYMQIDTAKKLRWYDREDLSQLISLTTREKVQLQDTIAALRQVRQSP